MSYILDALRKAERERQPARPPLLEKLLAASASPRVRPWPWLMVGALLANAVVLAILLTWRGPRSEPERTSPPVTPASPQVSAAPTPPRAVATVQNAPTREVAPVQQEARHETDRTGRERLLKSVAHLKLTMLLYSESAAQRLALINGRQYFEGQKIADTVLVEAITPTRVVLLSEGERYLLTP